MLAPVISRSERCSVKIIVTLLLYVAGVIVSQDSVGGDFDHIAITTLSSDPERISGGDVLVRIVIPPHTSNESVSMLLNGASVTTQFRPEPLHHAYVGLLSGLGAGTNTLDVKVRGERGASLKLINYPAQGPIVSGPHLAPFICQTSSFILEDNSTLGASQDTDCSAAPKINFVYLSSESNKLVLLKNPHELPYDVAKTVTSTGNTVNFIVRVETATVNRGIYQSAVLYDPTEEAEPSPFLPPKAWNRVLLVVHGGGCAGGWYIQGASRPFPFDVTRLGQGYAYFTNTLQNPSVSCNAFLAGETTMMSKERFIKTYGIPDYTLSLGDSGGAYTSLQVGDAFPGLFDGLLIGLTFPDALSIAVSGMDANLLRHYFLTHPTVDLGEDQQVAVSGYEGRKAWFDAANQAGRADAVPGRQEVDGYKSAVWSPVVPQSLRYDPIANRGGARPTIWDVARNIYSVDRKTNVALRPYDNVGVQYGLSALNAGRISTTQFLDLNEHVGGFDRDNNFVESRTVGDERAISEAYLSGLQLSGGGGLAKLPIIDLSGYIYESGAYHYQWFHFALRERLQTANGDLENFVMWRGTPTSTEPIQQKAFDFLNKWVSSIKLKPPKRYSRAMLGERRPAGLTDGCWTASDNFVAEHEVLDRDKKTACNALWPTYVSPRIVAGEPISANFLKCQLKPIDPRDYTAQFSTTERERLNRIFPHGVCDWSKAPMYYHAVSVGRSYGPSPSRAMVAE